MGHYKSQDYAGLTEREIVVCRCGRTVYREVIRKGDNAGKIRTVVECGHLHRCPLDRDASGEDNRPPVATEPDER